MKLMTINILISWFSSSMVFYGLILGAGDLSGGYRHIIVYLSFETILLFCFWVELSVTATVE